uniref:TNFR-Cys domain-containing protein n=1 Tax=Oncorhynchus tshawytscha TaxID=74940 RepID=A0A8C8F379_ONCTS
MFGRKRGTLASRRNGSSKWIMTPRILPKLWQNGLRTTKSRCEDVFSCQACWQVEGPGEAMRCQSCPAGTFSDSYDSDQCRPHSSCGVLNKKVVTSGTSHSDAVCGDSSPAQSTHVRAVRTVDKGSTGSGGQPVNGTAVRSPEEKSTEYAVFALVPIFCVMGLLGILICNILKKKGYNCTAEKEGGDEENATPQKEDDPNEDTISVLVAVCVVENAAALEELLLEYESKQMAISKASSIKFPVLSPLTHFLSLPRLCPHQSHLHTISGLSGLSVSPVTPSDLQKNPPAPRGHTTPPLRSPRRPGLGQGYSLKGSGGFLGR